MMTGKPAVMQPKAPLSDLDPILKLLVYIQHLDN